MEETFICTCCGETYPISALHMLEDQALCGDCMNQKALVCSFCGEIIRREENAGNENTPLCQNCYP